MGAIYEKIHVSDYKIKLYDFVVALYILALFIFENQKYSKLFAIVQTIFLVVTILNLIKSFRITKSYIYLWTLIFLTCSTVVTGFTSIGNLSTVRIILKNVVRCISFSIYLSSEIHRERFVKYIAFGGAATSATLISLFLKSEMVFSNIKYATNDRLGAEIAGGNVNIVAMNMAFAFTAFLYLYEREFSKKKKIILLSAMIIVSGTSLLTGSRKILLYYFVVMSFYAFIYKKNKLLNLISFTLLILVIYYCLMNIEPLYYLVGHKIDFFSGSTLYNMYNESDLNREMLIREGLKLFWENPLFGIGFGNTTHFLGVYAHNNYVEILASSGLFGFVLYYSMYFYIVVSCWKRIKNNPMILYAFLSTIGLVVIEYFQVTYLFSIPWAFFALASSIVYRNNKLISYDV